MCHEVLAQIDSTQLCCTCAVASSQQLVEAPSECMLHF